MKPIAYLLFFTILITASVIPVHATDVNYPSLEVAELAPALAPEARSAVLMEFDTGTILYAKNMDEKLPPASITKVMTMLLIFEALDQGKITYDDQVRVSENASSMGGSQIFLEVGEVMSVRDLLKGVAVASGNDAAVALAEHVAGTEEAFIKAMNEKAEELGLKNTHFVNTTGLPAENHYTSAHDIAIMSRELLKYSDVIQFTSIYEDYLRKESKNPFWLVNTNRLVKFYEGVDGLKTGYTSEAKFCLTATAKRDEMRLVAVVLGEPSSKVRNKEISSMFDYAFSQFQLHTIHEAGEPLEELRVDKGKIARVSIHSPYRVSVLLRKGEKADELETKLQLPEMIHAPLEKGTELGKLIISRDGAELASYPLVAQEEVAKANYFDLMRRVSQYFLLQP
ncbi:D-alanyl-D-alanine carboxypeptidase family protein [Rubeoparvulum massiliense]|uniref:D-alanyl-D-alanine carboxypeptidase family protein n=1 Tax=Rubeoparvulum massiliense TaxID=1631346 RepID=UPI00069FBAF0|nr:D-alanyl-D-alanine carboxypeptidase family protein [Rubeoparvulum massiliense]